MKIEVLVFAQLREALGSERVLIDVDEGATILDAVERVMGLPSLRVFDHLPLRYAVNEEFRSRDSELRPNDRLALLSPVAGG